METHSIFRWSHGKALNPYHLWFEFLDSYSAMLIDYNTIQANTFVCLSYFMGDFFVCQSIVEFHEFVRLLKLLSARPAAVTLVCSHLTSSL